VHELGHLFLGHLGPDKHLSIDQRPTPGHAQVELEAESLAYLVCKRRGVTSKSESYLADYTQANNTVEGLDFYRLIKAAGQVETALGIVAYTLFEPKDERNARPANSPL
jgi:antirestriction protein ArdC